MNSPPSVIHVCTDFWPATGGIEQFVFELACRSAASGMKVAVLGVNRLKGVPHRLPAHEKLDCGLEIFRRAYFDLTYYKPLSIPQHLLRSYDIIHVHGLGAPLDWVAMTRWLHRRPVVLSTHGGIFHTQKLRLLKHMYFNTFARIALTRVDITAACSRSDAALFARISDRVVLIENGMALRPLLAMPMQYKIRGRCLYVGRLATSKGIERLISVAALVKRYGGRFELRLVGPDVEGRSEHLKALSRELQVSDRIDFVGAVSEEQLLREYQQAEIFLSASTYEGFGLSAMQAKAAGCRLLLNRNAAFEANFGSDIAAVLVDFTDMQAAATAWAAMLSGPGIDSDLDRARWDADVYSWERKFGTWQSLYQRLGGATAQALPRVLESL